MRLGDSLRNDLRSAFAGGRDVPEQDGVHPTGPRPLRVVLRALLDAEVVKVLHDAVERTPSGSPNSGDFRALAILDSEQDRIPNVCEAGGNLLAFGGREDRVDDALEVLPEQGARGEMLEERLDFRVLLLDDPEYDERLLRPLRHVASVPNRDEVVLRGQGEVQRVFTDCANRGLPEFDRHGAVVPHRQKNVLLHHVTRYHFERIGQFGEKPNLLTDPERARRLIDRLARPDHRIERAERLAVLEGFEAVPDDAEDRPIVLPNDRVVPVHLRPVLGEAHILNLDVPAESSRLDGGRRRRQTLHSGPQPVPRHSVRLVEHHLVDIRGHCFSPPFALYCASNKAKWKSNLQ